MEFGLQTPAELVFVDFTLPPDGAHTQKILTGTKTGNPAFHVGCAKWGRKEWVELIYPPKTKEAQFLNAYVKVFNSIEFNAAFYRIPDEAQVLKWKEKADAVPDFLFCPKFSQPISHIKRLKQAEDVTSEFIKNIHAFGKHLGPCFLQMSDNFGPKNMDVLEQWLRQLPEDLKVFVELRHKDWFADPGARKAVFDLFGKLKKGAIITDASGRRDCVHMELTTPETFIRFVGIGKDYHAIDRQRIDMWTERLKVWLDNGLEHLYFFLHQHDEADTPKLAQYTIDKFNDILGSDLQCVKLLADEPPLTLF